MGIAENVLPYLQLTIFLYIIITGLIDILTNYETNGCSMTWMHNPPEYLKVQLNKQVTEKFPRYRLFLYGEGAYAQKSRTLDLRGVPVLFIPGNAGSYKQVRSLGTVSLDKAQKLKTNFHLDYFSVDLNEELSAFSGHLIQQHTEFVHLCLRRILELYKNAKNPPRSVLLVGHSMGGLIAQALFTLPDFDHKLVHTIITQATPHQASVFSPDGKLEEFYSQLISFWHQHADTAVKHVTIVSTGGGYRDLQVRGGLTSLRGIVPNDRGVSSNAMSVPKAWVATDHLSIVWCNEFVLTTVRAIFDIVDPKTLQVTEDTDLKMRVFRHHFVQHPGTTAFKHKFEDTLTLSEDMSVRMFKDEPSWVYNTHYEKATTYISVPISKDTSKSFVAVTNLHNDNWVAGCKISESKECTNVTNLAHYGYIIPPVRLQRKTIHLNPEQLKEFSHIVLIVPKGSSEVDLMVDLYDTQTRHSNISVPGFFTEFPRSVLVRKRVFASSIPQAVFYNLTIPYLETVRQAYKVYLTPLKCSGRRRGSLMTLHVPWANEDVHKYSGYLEPSNLTMKFQTGMPGEGQQTMPQLHLYLNPDCEYKLEVSLSLSENFGQILRFAIPLVPGLVMCSLFLLLSWQMKNLDTESVDRLWFYKAYQTGTNPGRLFPVIMPTTLILTNEFVHKVVFDTLGVPTTDGDRLTKLGVWNVGALPNAIMISNTVGLIFGGVVYLLVLIIAKVLGSFCCKLFSAKTILRGPQIAQYCIILLAVIVSIVCCGTLGLIILAIFHLLKVIGLRYIYAGSPADADVAKAFHLQFTLLLILAVDILINIASLALWVTSVKYQLTLGADSSRLPTLILCVAALILTFCENRDKLRKFSSIPVYIVHMTAFFVPFYGMKSAYRVPYIVAVSYFTIAIGSLYQSIFQVPSPPSKIENGNKKKMQ